MEHGLEELEEDEEELKDEIYLAKEQSKTWSWKRSS